MSSKGLFDKGKSYKVLPSVDPDTLGLDAESHRNIEARVEEKNRFIPNLDFSDASNFVHYGSAKKYYESAFDRITNEYPYDGSSAEKTEFLNESSYLDLYVLENEYPTTTGYAIISSDQWGSNDGFLGTGAGAENAWGKTNDLEYIKVFGGPHTASSGMEGKPIHSEFSASNIYDADIYDTEGVLSLGREGSRESNLKFKVSTGVTTEFWVKKGAWLGSSLTDKEVIFDLWNGEASSSSGYGRLLIYLTGSSDGQNPIRAHLASGSNVWDIAYGGSTVVTSSLEDTWNHIALTFYSGSSQIESNFYLNGNLQESKTNTSLTSFGEVTGSLIAFVGALQTTPSGNVYTGGAGAGAAKLSASIDEFRYWKAVKTHEEVGKNYFRHVDGGTNTDISNTELGVYFKFNEGITTDTETDSIVLDYSGRISNGSWVGYPGSAARNTGSAMVSASAADFEEEDPIIYGIHPDVSSSRSSLSISGSAYDYQNNSSLYYSLPTWVIEEDDEKGEILNLTQILASYLDTLHTQISEMPRLKDVNYVSSSQKPYPFSSRLLESNGMFAPEIFVDASVLEQIRQQSETEFYEKDLSEVKNLIYQNIYNNLVYIYKSKGTEKSFRNIIRCYGVDDDLIKVNVYGNNVTHKLRENYKNSVAKKRYADFSRPARFTATVTHQTSSANTNTVDVTYVTGSSAYQARTAEVEVLFPRKPSQNEENYFSTTFLTSSIMGWHRVKTSNDITDFTYGYSAAADRSLQLYAVRPSSDSRDAYFLLSNRAESISLTSDTFQDVYDDTKWNFAIRTYLSKDSQADYVSGSFGTSGETDIIVELFGCNVELGVVKNQFTITGSLAASSTNNGYITNPRRYYAGAHRENHTGSVLFNSDVKLSSVRHWESLIEDSEVISHARDAENFGVLRPHESAFLYNNSLLGTRVPKAETLSLHWNFDDVKSSDSSGEFLVNDFSSGSVALRDRYPGTFGEIVGNQYTGRGYFFESNASSSISVEYIQTAKQQPPEVVTSDDMTNIMEFDDETFERDSRTINHFFAVEKSMYQTISEEMLNMFSTIVGFNNLIGEPVNKYRHEYKDMSKLRNLFFENVENVPDLDKYVDFYRWIDASLSIILRQLIPASANTSEDIRNMIESHVLERNKYQHKFPTLELKPGEIVAGIRGVNTFEPDELGLPNWRFAHAPVSDDEADNTIYWQYTEATHPVLSSSDAGVNKTRAAIIGSKRAARTRKFSTPVKITSFLEEQDQVSREGTGRRTLHGGINYPVAKKQDAFRSVLDFGTSNGFLFNSIENVLDINDVLHPQHKKYQYFKESNNELKGELYAPFRILSGSESGYNSSFSNFQTVNLHTDSYLDGGELPIQGPFTQKHVGGMASRHTPINAGSDDITNRAESWSLSTTSTSLTFTHPATANPRDMISRNVKAKRPLNLENIKITGSSALGNYSNIREVVLVSGREGGDSQFVRNEGVSVTNLTSDLIDGIVDTEVSFLTSSEHMIISRFSAPGGVDTSHGGLDIETTQFSVYNALPYRNLLVRKPLVTLLSASTSQFGFRPGVTATAADYSGVANFHKINRNTLRRIEYSNEFVGDLGTVATGTVNDNFFMTRPIPQSDLQYLWITSSYESTETGGTRTSGRAMLGYAPRDFEVSTSAGYVNAITFTSESHVAGDVVTDFVGLNTTIVEPVSASEQTLGYPLTVGISSYNPSSYGSLSEGNVLSAILSHRGDTFGYNSWRQLRVGASPVARKLKETHKVSVIFDDVQNYTSDGRVLEAQRYGNFKQFRESPIVSKYKPITQVTNGIKISSTYANNRSNFSNAELDELYPETQTVQFYDKVKNNYQGFVSLQYRETVYPSEDNFYDNRIRQREGYTIDYWHSDRQARTDNKADKISLGGRSLYSVWSLDAPTSFSTMAVPNATNETSDPPGELQNKKTQVHNNTKTAITASALYALPHMVATTASFVSPSGIALAETGSAAGGSSNPFGYATVGAGAALWEAGALAGRVENGVFVSSSTDRTVPAYDSYSDYAEELRAHNKDYSIVPEFRISDHMDLYISQNNGNFLVNNTASFSIFGATSNADYPTDSSQTEFYNVYTNSDFLKYFNVVDRDHKDIADQHSITLRCKALMKFLPYNGFYPAERTLQMAEQFSSSYGKHVNYAGADSTLENAKMRPFLEPMFAPGIVYNSIKSGIGIPYPVLTASYGVQRLNDYYAISSSVNGSSFRKVDFEAAIEPEKYLSDVSLVDMSPHPSCSLNLTASWNGKGDPLYRMMASNFFAEVPEFFLPQGNMSAITSLPESDPRFGNAISGSVYGMRVRMFRSMNKARTFSGLSYAYPQDSPVQSGLHETFTMYSRPSAFFHAVSGRNTISNSQFESSTYGDRVLDSYNGYNWVATPPYYHGEAWVDILFIPTETKKYKLSEILSSIESTRELRFDNNNVSIGNDAGYYANGQIRNNMLNITDTLILDGRARIKSVEYDPDTGRPVLVKDDPSSDHVSYVIQPKWETPMFDFGDTGVRPITNAAGNLTIPTNGSESVPRGMWHQFGLPADDPEKGIFLQAYDIPKDWLNNHPGVGATPSNYNNGEVESLIDLLGIDQTPRRLGEVSTSKVVSEAIVAVPFVDKGTQKKFFSIDRAMIDHALEGKLGQDNSIQSMVEKLNRYVMPPKMDFITNKQITPFAAYVFEFEHEFDKDDLTHIWQNLPPKSVTKAEQKETTISHRLLADQVLSDVDSQLQWMVFKVKQKAVKNYFSKTASKSGDNLDDPRYKFQFKIAGRTEELDYSYNWPYDFFSLVEMVKIDAEVELRASGDAEE
tara:strand:- start:3698 stop:12079 length:8382 start_codon:yes stop_codon:yes gene_type:complete